MWNKGEHIYDSLGICQLCDKCNDPECCDQGPCDNRKWAFLHKLIRGPEYQHHKIEDD